MATRRTAAAAGLSLAAALLLGACASVPSGPSVLVLPGSNKSFEQFRADEQDCRQYASSQLGGTTPDQAAVDSAAKSASQSSARNAQWRYDVGYQQCMYAKGHKVPVAASQFRSEPGRPRRGAYPPPPPPPPPGSPPPDAAKPG